MVGFVVGGLVMTGVADRLREGQWIAISFVGMGLVNAIYSQISTVPLAIALGAIMAFMNVPSYIGRQLVIQRNTTREVRGRVTSAYYVTRDVMFMLGMGAAALADLLDIRLLILVEGLLLVGLGASVLFMPGLGQPAAEWRKALSLLRRAAEAPGLELGRPATVADFDRLVGRVPAMSVLSAEERQQLAAQARVQEAPAGTVIVRKGEVSDAAYFLLNGRTFAGWEEAGSYRVLEMHRAGDFFGEIAALTAMPRTAHVVAEEDTTLLQVPAAALREMTAKAELNRLFLSKMTERMVRMNMLDIPRMTSRDQELLRELRTPEPQLEGHAIY